jgi:PAS domain S-box-containing protein
VPLTVNDTTSDVAAPGAGEPTRSVTLYILSNIGPKVLQEVELREHSTVTTLGSVNASADVAAIREARRLEAVRRLRIIDTEPEQAFDDIVTLATQLCRMPIGFVGFFDEQRLWFKAQKGVDVWQVPRAGTLAEYTIESGAPLIIPDVQADKRLAGNIATFSAMAGAYAGVPLFDPEGVTIGVLAVVDWDPRTLTSDQIGMLEALGRQVEQLFALHATLVARGDDHAEALEREARFRSVLQSLASGVVTLDHDGVVQDCNPAAEKILGLTRERMVGRSPLDAPVRHEDGRLFKDDERPVMVTLRYGIDVRDVVMGIEREDGSSRWLLLNSSPLWDQFSRSNGAVVTFADVSDLFMLNTQLQESLGELARAAQERAALLSSVSHDIRAPLAAIRMMTEILEDRGDAITAMQRDELIRRVRVEARRTEGVLTDLVSANRVGAGLEAPRRTRIDLEQLICARAREFDGSDHAISVGSVIGEMTMWADAAQVERILDNLISNAITHTPAGTRVHIEAHEHNGWIDVSVDDDGPGVPEHMRQRIFTAYARGERSADRPGSGLGLFLVAQFAQFHGGTARYEVSQRGGARLVVSLPRRPGQGSEGVGQQTGTTSDSNGFEL